MSRTDDGPRPHHLPALAAPRARSTDVVQAAKGLRQVVALGSSALAGCFTCPIDVKDDPGISCSIHQTTCLLVRREWAAEQIIEEERAQGFDGYFGQRC